MSPPNKGDGRPDVARKCTAVSRTAAGTLNFFTIEEVADFLSLSTRSVRRLISRGLLPVHRFGRAVRIAEADLRVYIATHRE